MGLRQEAEAWRAKVNKCRVEYAPEGDYRGPLGALAKASDLLDAEIYGLGGELAVDRLVRKVPPEAIVIEARADVLRMTRPSRPLWMKRRNLRGNRRF